VSHEQDLQNSSILCSIVANIAVVTADVELQQTRLRRKGTKNIVRKYRKRTWTSFLQEGISNAIPYVQDTC
jgi:hypothetical protein